MNATAIREAARVVALIAILALAAVLGLAVGNAINGRQGTDAISTLNAGNMVPANRGGTVFEPADYVDYGVRHASAPDSDSASLTLPTPR